MSIYRLDFLIKNGLAKGFRVVLTHQSLDWHKNKYGNMRPYLSDDSFLDTDVELALNEPGFVYRGLNKRGIPSKKFCVFYREIAGQSNQFGFKNIHVKSYVRIVCRKSFLSRKLEIITILKTNHINEQKKCKPISTI